MKTCTLMITLLYLAASPYAKANRPLTTENNFCSYAVISPIENDEWAVTSSTDSISVQKTGQLQNVTISICDENGNLVNSTSGVNKNFVLQCPFEGLYIVRVNDQNGNEIFRKKIWVDGK